jgi:LemA protein
MKKSWLIIGGIVLLVIILFGWWRGTYNSLVQSDENVRAQLGQLNNTYQQRADLIPNLVRTVEASAVAERQTLEAVVNARSRASSIQLTPELLNNPQAFQQFQQAQGELSGALSRLMVVVEKYPDLRSQQNFTNLMAQLEGQENRIRIERNRYNETVNTYNRQVRSFPTSIIAGMSGFAQYPYFQAAEGAENAPPVEFGSGLNSPSGQPAPSTGTTPAPGGTPTPESQPRGAARPAPVNR